MPLIECVPNVSEGRRLDVVAAIADAVRGIRGVRLLDCSSDPAHHRSVLTFAGSAASIEQAALAMFDQALQSIDLREHDGVHPRVGAVDVIPFVPIEDATMADCVTIAKRVGAAIGQRFQVPVFLYEEASQDPARKQLEQIRRGGLEGLRARLATGLWTPDYGPAALHPTAGATVVGARKPLIAYNVNLGTDRLDVAANIASIVRASSGGYRHVKAIGVRLTHRGIVQVSMNLTNYEETPIAEVFEAVRREAARHGVEVLESEIVGLVPAAALVDAAAFYLKLKTFTRDQVLETRLAATS